MQQLGPNQFQRIKYENSDELSLTTNYATEQTNAWLQLDWDRYETIQDLVSTKDDLDFVREAQSLGVKANAHHHLFLANRTFTLGVNGYHETLEQNKREHQQTVVEVPDETSTGIAVFAQDDWRITRSFNAVTGLRAQWDTGFGLFTSPKVAARWDAWQGEQAEIFIRASSGIGYRTPSIKERFYQFDHSQLGYEVLGRSDLKPEISFSHTAEMGGSVVLGFELLDWSLSAYRHDIKNLIEVALEPSSNQGIDTYQYSNLGNTQISGVEAKVTLPFDVALARVETQLAYQQVHAVDENTGLALLNRPKHSVQASQKLQFNSRWQPSLRNQLTYHGKRQVSAEPKITSEAYFTLDSYFSFAPAEPWQINLGVSNLTNQTRELIEGDIRPLLGRTWQISLQYQYD